MSAPQPSFSVDVDVTNPGQYLACCGLLELVQRLSPDGVAEGWFMDRAFHVAGSGGGSDAFNRVLEMLGTPTSEDASRGDRTMRPVCIAALSFTMDWWIDHEGSKTPFKLWAGQQTSLRIVKDLQNALPHNVEAKGLFQTSSPMTGRFGVDPRAAWNALDVGFSPNEQGMKVQTFPAVELLAAVGLQRFRPVQVGRAAFRYALWSSPLSVSVACAAAACLLPGVKAYEFQVTDRGSYKGFDYAIPIGGKI